MKASGQANVEILGRTDEWSSECKAAYSELSEITLARMISFNRRRVGEVERISVAAYEKRKKHDGHGSQLMDNWLSEVEKRMCSAFTRIEVTGKKGKTVPILVSPDMEVWIASLMKYRRSAGIADSNVYLFARSSFGSEGHLRGCEAMKKLSERSNAKFPELLRSTKLRKHVATITQILNLETNELDIVAKFLGHDIRTHREYYRLPHDTLQLAKVSKLLFAAERGDDITGKSLSDIDVGSDEGRVIFSRPPISIQRVYCFFQSSEKTLEKTRKLMMKLMMKMTRWPQPVREIIAMM